MLANVEEGGVNSFMLKNTIGMENADSQMMKLKQEKYLELNENKL
jgi:hypothetical protein